MPTATAERLDPRLVARAQRMVGRDGKVPSQRALMDALKIGRPRAAEVLAALTDAPAAATPDAPADAPEVRPAVAPETHEPATDGCTQDAVQVRPPDAVEVHLLDAPACVRQTHPPAIEDASTDAPADAVVDAPAEPAEVHPQTRPETHPLEPAECAPAALADAPAAEAFTQVSAPVGAPDERTPDAPADAHPDAVETQPADAPQARTAGAPRWPLLILCAPAFVAIWAGWVALGRMTGFGRVNLLPGFGSGWTVDTAITLPIGVETYAAYALWVWLSGRAPTRARAFARWSAIGSLALGAAGQVAYHLMAAAGIHAAPWQITTVVACLPVAVLGAGAALAHLMHEEKP